MQRREDSKLVFFVDVKANNNLTRQAVLKPYGTDVTKVNILIRPDREKMMYVCLAPDCCAVDVAKKIGIIYTESSCIILNIYFFSP